MTFELLGITINLKKEVIIAGAAALLLLGSITGYLLVRDDSDIIVEAHEEQSAQKQPLATAEPSTAMTSAAVVEKEIKIYITGCVNSPGIVSLKKGQLIDDAIKLAGGATAEADIGGINLVYELRENLMLYIRSKNEKPDNSTKAPGEAGKGIVLVKDSGGAVINESSGTSSENGLININSAAPDELDKLPGIGEATARDIIAYRESNGPFKTIQDIMKVPRIKESRFTSIKDFITVD